MIPTKPAVRLNDIKKKKKIQDAAEDALRYTRIDSYKDLFFSLRLSIKQTCSIPALKTR